MVALANLNSAKVFTDIQNDSLISLKTPQTGYVTGDFGEESSLLARGPILQHQGVAEDDSEVREVEPPVVNKEAKLSNDAFFDFFCLSREVTSFLSFIRDRFPCTFFKVHSLL